MRKWDPDTSVTRIVPCRFGPSSSSLVDNSNLLLDRVLALEHVIDLSQVISPWEKIVWVASWGKAPLEMSTLTEAAHLHMRSAIDFQYYRFSANKLTSS
jgi:hypothetical protein